MRLECRVVSLYFPRFECTSKSVPIFPLAEEHMVYVVACPLPHALVFIVGDLICGHYGLGLVEKRQVEIIRLVEAQVGIPFVFIEQKLVLENLIWPHYNWQIFFS